MLFFEIQVVNWKVRNYWITCCLASQHPSIHCYRKIVVHISVMNRHNILGIINDYYVCPHLTGKHTKLAIQQHKSIIRVQKMLTDCRFHSWSSIMKSMPNWYQYIASALNLIHIFVSRLQLIPCLQCVHESWNVHWSWIQIIGLKMD